MNNMRTFLAIIILLGVIVIGIWLPGNESINDLGNIRIPSDQLIFLKQYQLGLLNEQRSRWPEAIEQYGEALKATETDIVLAAKDGSERSIKKQFDWPYTLQHLLRTLFWLLLNIAIIVLAFLSVIWLSSRLYTYFKKEDGYTLLPIEDYSQDDLGKGGHLLVHSIFQQTKQVHLDADKMLLINADENDFPSFGAIYSGSEITDNAFSVVESIEVAGIEVKLTPLLKIWRHLFQRKKHIIFNQLLQQGRQLHLDTQIKRTSDNQVIQTWHLSGDRELSLIEQTGVILEELAFRMLIWSPQGNLGTESWKSLQLLTQALETRQRYNETADIALLQDAKSTLEQVIKLDSRYVTAYYALGGIYNNLGQYKEAEDKFSTIAQNGNNLYLEAKYNFGVSSFHLAQSWAYEQAVKHFQDILNELSESSPKPKEQLLLALAHCGMARVADMEIRRPQKEWTGDKKKSRIELVQEHTEKALNLVEKIKYDENIRNLVKSIIYYARGSVSRKQGDFDEARELFNQAITLRPNYPVPYVSLAQTFDDKSDEHLRWLKKATEIQPKYEYAHLLLGEAYLRRRQRDAAREAFRQAPNISRARSRLGEILVKDGTNKPTRKAAYEAAMEQFQIAVDLNSHNKFAWHNMVWRTLQAMEEETISVDDDKLDQTIEWGQQVVKYTQGEDDEWWARDVLGWALVMNGELDEAEKELKISINLANDQFQNHYHLALVYEASGNYVAAQAELEQALAQERPQGSLKRGANRLAERLKKKNAG